MLQLPGAAAATGQQALEVMSTPEDAAPAIRCELIGPGLPGAGGAETIQTAGELQ